MTDYRCNERTVAALLAEAFPEEPVPHKEALVPAEYLNLAEAKRWLLDDLGYTEVLSTLGGRSWRQITADEVCRYVLALELLPRSAFAYYVPAWCLWSARDQQVRECVVDTVVALLEYAPASLWSDVQRQAICEWLFLVDKWNREGWQLCLLGQAVERAIKRLRSA